MFLRPSTETSHTKPRRTLRGGTAPAALPEPVLVREASAADDARIRVLAELDGQRLPAGPFLVAELSDVVAAATSLTSGAVLADPFRRTREATDLLRLRAAQIAEHDLAEAAQRPHAALAPAAA